MIFAYKTLYKDEKGEEKTIILNDGQTLKMTARGATFKSTDFEDFEHSKSNDKFTLIRGVLSDYSLNVQIPVIVVEDKTEYNNNLIVDISCGTDTKNNYPHTTGLQIKLEFNDISYSSKGSTYWFEDELLDIQRKLPENTYMKACINCLYSDYSPYGHGTFGNMMCFRNLKEEYLKVKSKDEFWSVHDRFDTFVQETDLCLEFERRVPGTGYRG